MTADQDRSLSPTASASQSQPPLQFDARARFDRLVTALSTVAAGVSLPQVLRHVAESACALVEARYGALGVIGDDGRLAEFITVGASPQTIEAIGHYPEGLGILGRLIVDPTPLRLDDLSRHPDSVGFPPNHPPMQTLLGVPIHIGDTVFGNLYLCDKIATDDGGATGDTAPGEFTPEDQELVKALAGIAAVAIENARLHERLQELAVLEDRERIARDLHDVVIQRLFATGMTLQASARLLDAEVGARIIGAVEDLDSIISEIRSTIFDLQRRPTERPLLAAAALAVVDEIMRPTTIEPIVQVDGRLDEAVNPDLGDDVLAVLRECLSNVVRHSGAGRVEITIRSDSSLTIRVADDGRGPAHQSPRSGRGRGIGNLTARAQARNGTFGIEPATGGGTVAEWIVPLL